MRALAGLVFVACFAIYLDRSPAGWEDSEETASGASFGVNFAVVSSSS